MTALLMALKASLHSADVLWDCLDGLCLRERETHPTLGKPEDLLAVMLKKR